MKHSIHIFFLEKLQIKKNQKKLVKEKSRIKDQNSIIKHMEKYNTPI
jgi:hypothetical protein